MAFRSCIDPVAVFRRALAWLVALALAGAMTAAESPSEQGRAARDSRHPDIRLWLPLHATAIVNSDEAASAPRSSAASRGESNCPPGTWRWAADGRAQQVEFAIASALIIRIETSGQTDAPGGDDPLARAGEEIAHTFRVRTGLNARETDDLAFRFSSTTDAVGRLLAHWKMDLEHNIEAAARAIERAMAGSDSRSARLTVIVAREHVVADCAPIETCEGGRWLEGGLRAVSTRRIPLAPLFHEPEPFGQTGNEPAPEAARSAMAFVGRWLSANYAREAAAAAILADGGDPRALAASTGIVSASR